jgi:hypothetical protein
MRKIVGIETSSIEPQRDYFANNHPDQRSGSGPLGAGCSGFLIGLKSCQFLEVVG